jgi:thiamine biosynthesis lipoprotein
MSWKNAASGLLGLIVAASTNFAAPERLEYIEPHMGTLFRIVLYPPDPAIAKAATRAAFDRIAALNRIMSDYDPTSELMRLCAQAPTTPVPVSAELFDILLRSQAIAEKTHGAFDVTLGPVIRLWRETRRTHALPSDDARTAAQHASGFKHLRLDPVGRTVTLLRPHMALDLGGIAKGYAAQAALTVLAQHGITCAMVAASGDLALGDPPPGKTGWKIELNPFGSTTGTPLTLIVAHAGVSTSGDTEQFVTLNGVRYSHIVDPATGLGLTRPTAVTVVAQHATLADALATACSVLAPAAAQQLADHSAESVRVIVHQRNADGSTQSTSFGHAPAGLISTP